MGADISTTGKQNCRDCLSLCDAPPGNKSKAVDTSPIRRGMVLGGNPGGKSSARQRETALRLARKEDLIAQVVRPRREPVAMPRGCGTC